MKKIPVESSVTQAKLLQKWDVTPQEAAEIQMQLYPDIICQDQFVDVNTIGGVDTSFMVGGGFIQAVACLLGYPNLQEVECSIIQSPSNFPYIPGLLSFREAPAILEAYSNLSYPPDLLFCDGHGLAHPRRFGLACHLGLLFNVPSIGVAKSLLVGVHNPPDDARGSWQPIIFRDQVIGAALRTQPGVKPVYVSIGHRISLETAIEYVLRCTPKYRLPTPIRIAHHLASSNQEKL